MNPSRSHPDPALASLVDRTRGLQPWRRLFHATNGVLVVAALAVLDPPWSLAVGVLAAVTAGAFALDGLRFAWPALNRLFFRLLRPLASPREAKGAASSSWYMLGVLLAVASFPREVAMAAILVLALADPAASWIGRRWGKRRLGSGTWLGSAVVMVVATGIAATYLVVPGTGFEGIVRGLVGALVVGAVTALAEAFSRPLDDNLVLPLVAGAVLWSLVPLV